MSSSSNEPGTLYVVSTPLGNLGDVTLRALETLSSVDVIAAEDTRRTRKLLSRHGIRARSVSLHKFNEERSARRIVEMLRAGKDVAYVTDSGTPGVSDPGARLVRHVRAQGLGVIPLPGPSAVVAAMSVSGWEGPFAFAGYVERKPGARRRQLEELCARDGAVVLFEAPTRVRATLEVLAEVAGEHRILLAREMTKIHEQYALETASGHLDSLVQPLKGEITMVLMPGEEGPGRVGADLARAVEAAAQLVSLGVKVRQASRIVASLTGASAKEIYGGVTRSRR